jgi:hypothetical protein
MPYADWAEVRRALSSALEGLADGEFFVMGEGSPDTEPRPGLFGRRPQPTPARYVQAIRITGLISAECVGATSLGGTWAMDENTIEQLRSMGWQTPAESEAEYGHLTPNFDLYVEMQEAQSLPDVMVASLAVLGADPRALALQCPGGSAQLVG